MTSDRKRRILTFEGRMELANRGISYDYLATKAALDAEDWEILGQPPPDEQPAVERRASV